MAKDDKEGGVVWLISKLVSDMAMTNVAESINVGRESGFNDIKNEIGAFQWSGLLDLKICVRCKWLDGRYFDVDDPALDLIKPPLHRRGRCILVAVLKDELERFPVSITRLTVAQIIYLTENKIL